MSFFNQVEITEATEADFEDTIERAIYEH